MISEKGIVTLESGRVSSGALTNLLESEFVSSRFELQPCYYVHFRIHFRKSGINRLILSSMGNVEYQKKKVTTTLVN